MKTRKIRILSMVVAVLLGMIWHTTARATLPTVTLSNTATSPSVVCRSGNGHSVTITTTGQVAFDQNTLSTTVSNCTSATNKDKNNLGGISGANSDHTVTIVQTTVTNKKLVVTATDSNKATSVLTTNTSLDNTTTLVYSGMLDIGVEGKNSITVTATITETITTTKTISTEYFSTTNCSGTVLAKVPGTPSISTTTKSGTGTSATSYIVDLVGPTAKVLATSPPKLQQASDEVISVQLKDGSPNTPFKLAALVVSDDTDISFSGTLDDQFGKDANGSGTAPTKVAGPLAITIPCDAPIGMYHVIILISTQDLCGDSFNPIVLDGGSLEVIPGLQLQNQTLVLSELANGDYDLTACFTKFLQLNSIPGTFHIAGITTTTGPCAGTDSIGGVKITLTLPAGFTYVLSGKSPLAHVFIGDANLANGFDLHDPTPAFVEVTALVSITQSGNTVTIDLSKLGDLKGMLIYTRAHCMPIKIQTVNADTSCAFTSNSTVNRVNGVPTSMSAQGQSTIVGNPSNGCAPEGVVP